MPTKIVFAPKMPDPIMDTARAMIPEGFEMVVSEHDDPNFLKHVAGSEYYIGFPRAGMGEAFFKAGSGLKLVQLISAGYDRIDVAAAKKAGVPIANNGGANSVAVAEHTLMLILAVYKKMAFHHINVTAGKWRVGDFAATRTYELAGKKLGIVGLGTIGKKVARRAEGFDMDIQYYDVVRLSEDQEDALGVKFALFPELLQTSDVVSLHVPLNDATRWTLSNAFRKALVQFSQVGPAEWGVKVTFSRPKSGWLMSGGSSTMTSRPAAAICLDSSAWRRASSSTTGPRHVLMKIASFFIMPNSLAPIILRVASFSGTCRLTTSEV